MNMIMLKMFIVFIIPFFLVFASVGVNGYIVCRDLNKVLDTFKGSVIVSSYGDVWRGGSFLTRCTLSYIVMGSVVFPAKHIRNGRLDPKEFARLPGAIKLRMRLSVGLLMGAFVWFFLAVAVMSALE